MITTTTNINLPIAPNEESLQLLMRARLMLSHAHEHASQQTEFDNMIAILGLDNTIEYILRCIVTHLDLESTTGKNFDTFELANLAASINKALKEFASVSLPYLGEIKLLRQTRNLVQHGAVAPYADLDRFAKITERFFNKVLVNIFGFKLDDLKISSVIKDKITKKYLKNAENKIDSKKWLDSIVSTRNAFENELFQKLKHSNISTALYPNLVYSKEKDDFAMYGFQTIKEELELTYLGINNTDYRRFKEYLDHIPSKYRPEDSYGNIVMQRPWKKEDALFCYNFGANTILRWQSQEKGQLYPLKLDKEYQHNETIAGINITKHSEGGCSYYYDSDHRLYLFYTTKDIKRRFGKIKKGKEYKYKTVVYVDGKKESVHEERIKLIGTHIFLMTNEPERWGIIIWYKTIEKKA
ncbi:MAG: hypothetical protein HWN69_01925 [Desulfobacterales bacterium]|nr:hypothetical protein [Desulfobacterales bacterium]